MYQLKEEQAFRVVICYLHHSIPCEEIKEELKAEGFEARNVINIEHWKIKEPLPLFFVDLILQENNKKK